MSNSKNKNARRQERTETERGAARELDEAAAVAVDAALAVAPGVAGTGKPGDEAAIEAGVTNADGARFVLKRVNEVLSTHEYLDELRAWLWTEDENIDDAMTKGGAENGFEIRLTPRHA